MQQMQHDGSWKGEEDCSSKERASGWIQKPPPPAVLTARNRQQPKGVNTASSLRRASKEVNIASFSPIETVSDQQDDNSQAKFSVQLTTCKTYLIIKAFEEKEGGIVQITT
ncbi:hypothetical protein Cadr_000026480 [Camelus dromedarius]|uniref:Uncharacterized protein n=1 Tax=Camelus dromedarius TaxID=9838 RepID=A0A5N4CF95_CAMDR|nr:hypothetical protein Cadr_000026480 [Camelus dromedarius]